MKKIITPFFLIFSLYGFSQELTLKDGKYYNSDTLYTGIYREYSAEGILLVKLNIESGYLEGPCNYYFESGKIKEQKCYMQGKKNGTWYTWNEKGIKTAQAIYKEDKKDGKWYIWDDNGTLRYEMEYKDGNKTGKWSMWDENGTLVMEKTF
jgi:antitoxin component YwqK of YwqJK toxin-antitoxin module